MSNDVIWDRTIIYETTSTSTADFLNTDILKLFVVCDNGTTTSLGMLKAARLNGIRLKGRGDGTGTNRVTLEWAGTFGTDRCMIYEFGPTALERRGKYFRPPPSSQTARFTDLTADGTSMFKLDMTGLLGTLQVILNVSLVFGTGLDGPTVTSGLNGFVAPSMPVSTGLLVPLDLQTV